MAKALTVPAPTERDTKRERVLIAAAGFVYGPCASTLAELEDAVADYIGPKPQQTAGGRT